LKQQGTSRKELDKKSSDMSKKVDEQLYCLYGTLPRTKPYSKLTAQEKAERVEGYCFGTLAGIGLSCMVAITVKLLESYFG
jgi:hypothetical protein